MNLDKVLNSRVDVGDCWEIFKFRSVTCYLLDNGCVYRPEKAPDPFKYQPTEAGDEEQPSFELKTLPLPFTHADFQDLDVWQACMRRVADKVEETTLASMAGVPSTVKFREVPEAIQELKNRKFFGPYVVICSPDEWRTRRLEYGAVEDVDLVLVGAPMRKDDLLVFQATPDVVRMVVGLEPCVVKWDGKYKAVCVLVPQIRSDFQGNYGIAVRSLRP